MLWGVWLRGCKREREGAWIWRLKEAMVWGIGMLGDVYIKELLVVLHETTFPTSHTSNFA